MGQALEVWRGSVDAWECDQMGHMNVRFYVTRALEGLAGLAAALGMKSAFSPGASATLLVLDQHMRFLHECRMAAPLHMTGGVLEMTEDGARLLLTLIHSDSGLPAASFHLKVAHATPEEGRAFPWPERALRAAQGLMIELPDYAAPRGLNLDPPQSTPSLGEAHRMGLTAAAQGAVTPEDCDLFGRARPDRMIARINQGMGQLSMALRQAILDSRVEMPIPAERLGGAVVEYRVAYRSWPRAGDGIVVRSGLVGLAGKTRRLVHWLLDPASGTAWATAALVVVSFDLQTRKALDFPPAVMEALGAQLAPGLAL